MAYNFPVGYQPYYPNTYGSYTPQQNMTPQPAQSNAGLTWVTGEGGAKSYLVAPGCTIPLFDSENPVIYIKSADASGLPSMKILDYKIREATSSPTPPVVQTADFVTREEFHELEKKLEQLTSVKEVGANE